MIFIHCWVIKYVPLNSLDVMWLSSYLASVLGVIRRVGILDRDSYGKRIKHPFIYNVPLKLLMGWLTKLNELVNS